MIRSLVVLTLLVGYSTSQYAQQSRSGTVQQQPVQNVQAAQPEAIDQIPAWYQMAKPVASRVQQLPQASPSYYERIEPTYEQRRGEQPTYERPGIQTNQYANYPSYQNRQPYENLNALTSGASLSNLQANRRYPSGATGAAGGSDVSRLRTHTVMHVHHTPPTPSPASYTRTQYHHPGRVVWYTSKRVSPYNVIRTTLPPQLPPSLSQELRGVKKLIAMTSYDQTREQLSKWYDQMRAFYYINQFVDWGTFKNMFLN